ncbi:MAG: ComEC family competence protein [Clostridiales bacterium]|nr:ComEC family competence protein [Clostridiales bacterium]
MKFHSTRVVFTFTVFFVFGVVTGAAPPGAALFFAFAALVFNLAGCFSSGLRGKGFAAFFLIYALAAVLGFCDTRAWENPSGPLAEAAKTGQPVSFSGVVRDLSEDSFGRKLLLMRTDHGKLLVRARPRFKVRIGDELTARGQVSELAPPSEAFGFNEKIYYGSRGMRYKMNCKTIYFVSHKGGLFSSMAELRGRVSSLYDSLLPPDRAAALKAMLLGDRADLPGYLADLYKTGGIYHVLAVSGLHVTIMAFAANWLLTAVLSAAFGKPPEKSKRAKRVKAVVYAATIAFLLSYWVFTGFQKSCARAVVFFGVTGLAPLVGAKRDHLTTCSAAALILLAARPYSLWDLGFLLSFSAVLGLILMTGPIEDALAFCAARAARRSLPKGLRVSAGAAFAAFWATLPIGGEALPYLPLYSVPVNVLLSPTFAATIICGALMGVLGLFSPALAVPFAAGANALLALYENALRLVSRLPFALVYRGYWPVYVIAAYYAMWAALCRWFAGLRAEGAVGWLEETGEYSNFTKR